MGASPWDSGLFVLRFEPFVPSHWEGPAKAPSAAPTTVRLVAWPWLQWSGPFARPVGGEQGTQAAHHLRAREVPRQVQPGQQRLLRGTAGEGPREAPGLPGWDL